MLNIERSTVAEVYDQILKDCEAAKLLLPAVWEERADYPRPTSVAVTSYIGQANLYMGNYDAAKKALKEVIDSSGKEVLLSMNMRRCLMRIRRNLIENRS